MTLLNIHTWKQKGYRESELFDLYHERAREQLLMLITFESSDETVFRFQGNLPRHYIGGLSDFLAFTREVAQLPHGSLLLSLHDAIGNPLSTTVPVIGFSKRVDDPYSIPFPDPYYLYDWGYFTKAQHLNKIHENLPWERKEDVCFWRGASTGAPFLEGDSWRENPRLRLCMLAKEAKGERLDFLFSQLVQCRDPEIIAYIHGQNLVQSIVPVEDFSRYRYLVDIDGNASSWGFFLKMFMRSVILKVETYYEQWFNHMLEPGRHYLPVKRDLSDLVSVLEWARSHQKESQRIAQEAHEFATKWSYVACVQYYSEQLTALLNIGR